MLGSQTKSITREELDGPLLILLQGTQNLRGGGPDIQKQRSKQSEDDQTAHRQRCHGSLVCPHRCIGAMANFGDVDELASEGWKEDYDFDEFRQRHRVSEVWS